MEILGASQPGWYGEGSKGAGRECPVEQRTSQLLPARPPPGTPGASLKGRDQRRGLGEAGQGLGAAGYLPLWESFGLSSLGTVMGGLHGEGKGSGPNPGKHSGRGAGGGFHPSSCLHPKL